MKSAYSTLVLMLFSTSIIFSQISIDASDAPAIGTVLNYATDTLLTGITAGMSGTNQSWDFTGLDADETLTNNVVDPTTTPSTDIFPNADIAFESDGLYSYASIDEVGLYALGGSTDQGGVEFTVAFDPLQQLLANPTTYGTTFNSEFGFELEADGSLFGVDSIRVREVGTTSSEADATGILTVPAGDFDVLRVYTETNTIDSIWVKFFGFWSLLDVQESTSYSYEWWTEGGIGSVITMDIDADGNALSIQYLTSYSAAAVAPLAAFEWEHTSMNDGATEFTDISSNAPESWLWDFGDGNTSAMQNPSHIFAEPGTYTVCLTVSNTAGSDMTCEDIVLVFTSTDDLISASGINIYPNPASNQLYLKNDALNGKIVEGVIYNTAGQSVQTFKLGSLREFIDISALKSGNYFLELKVDKQYYQSIPFVKG